MDLKSIIKKISISTCVIFTAITICYCILVSLINPDAEEILFEGTRIVLFFFFSLIVSLANAVLAIESLPSWSRHVIHYVLCTFAFYLCVLFPSVQANTKASFVIVGISLFTVLYVLVAAVVSIFKSKIKRNKEKKETYTKRFSK